MTGGGGSHDRGGGHMTGGGGSHDRGRRSYDREQGVEFTGKGTNSGTTNTPSNAGEQWYH